MTDQDIGPIPHEPFQECGPFDSGAKKNWNAIAAWSPHLGRKEGAGPAPLDEIVTEFFDEEPRLKIAAATQFVLRALDGLMEIDGDGMQPWVGESGKKTN